MSEEASNHDESTADRVRWTEPLGAFAGVVVVLAGLSGLATVWAPLANHILAVAAVVFIGVPFVILRRCGGDFHRFGIDLERIPLRQVGLGLLVSLAIFPLYAAGHHVWETSVEQRQFEPSSDNYRQWSVELEAPSMTDDHRPSLQVRTFSDALHIQWTDPATEASMTIDADRSFRFDHASGLALRHLADETNEDPAPVDAPLVGVDTEPSDRWKTSPIAYGRDGHLTLNSRPPDGDERLPDRLHLELDYPAGVTAPDVYVGTSSHPADEPIEVKRTYWWLVIWGLSHLILVALPEEYFYRGYLQTRIGDLLGGEKSTPDKPKTILGISRANWVTSGLFALGHVLIPIGGSFSLARGAVFFPSLVFGWLKDRTGSIIASTIFHAAANMMVLIVAVHYF